MDPSNRKLMQVTIEDAAQADRIITILMGDKVDPRREYISTHANFSRSDDFVPVTADLDKGAKPNDGWQ
jgi:DNA gyrase/topoisomerase IV subunit B